MAKSSLLSQHKLVDYKHICADTLVKGVTRLQGQLLDGRPVGRGRVQPTHVGMTAGAQHKLPRLPQQPATDLRAG